MIDANKLLALAGNGRRVEITFDDFSRGGHIINDQTNWTLSVQWGPHTYCANRGKLTDGNENAEIAIWQYGQEMVKLTEHDSVASYIEWPQIEAIAEILSDAALTKGAAVDDVREIIKKEATP